MSYITFQHSSMSLQNVCFPHKLINYWSGIWKMELSNQKVEPRSWKMITRRLECGTWEPVSGRGGVLPEPCPRRLWGTLGRIYVYIYPLRARRRPGRVDRLRLVSLKLVFRSWSSFRLSSFCCPSVGCLPEGSLLSWDKVSLGPNPAGDHFSDPFFIN